MRPIMYRLSSYFCAVLLRWLAGGGGILCVVDDCERMEWRQHNNEQRSIDNDNDDDNDDDDDATRCFWFA